MLEKIVTFLAEKSMEQWDAIVAVMVGIFFSGIAHMAEVKKGNMKWDISTFLLSVTSAGLFSFVTYMVCLELLNWSSGLSIAASGVIAHLGADKVKQMLTSFFMRKFQ